MPAESPGQSQPVAASRRRPPITRALLSPRPPRCMPHRPSRCALKKKLVRLRTLSPDLSLALPHPHARFCLLLAAPSLLQSRAPVVPCDVLTVARYQLPPANATRRSFPPSVLLARQLLLRPHELPARLLHHHLTFRRTWIHRDRDRLLVARRGPPGWTALAPTCRRLRVTARASPNGLNRNRSSPAAQRSPRRARLQSTTMVVPT